MSDNLSSRYIWCSKNDMSEEIKYTVADAKEYIESLTESGTVSKLLKTQFQSFSHGSTFVAVSFVLCSVLFNFDMF